MSEIEEVLHGGNVNKVVRVGDTIGAAEGEAAFVKMVEEGHLSHYEKEIKFLSSHFNDWTTAG